MLKFTTGLAILTLLTLTYAFGVEQGKEMRQETIEDRALELPDPYEVDDKYSWGDIEYIVYGNTN